MHFILFYDYVDDILERRKPYREEHLALLQKFVERGEVLLGGAFADPTDGAVIVFNVDSRALVEQFVEKDPFVINGLVTGWWIREWTVSVGSAL